MEEKPHARRSPIWIRIVLTAILCLVFVSGLTLLAIWLFTPEKLNLSLSARSLKDGPRTVALRAVDPGDLTKELYKTSLSVEVNGGMLRAEWLPPAELQGQPYIVELCAKHNGDVNESCFEEKVNVGVDTDMASTQPLRSCPYFVSEVRSSKLSNLVNANMVSLDSRVLCGDGETAGVDDFAPVSRIDQLQTLKTPGLSLSLGDGVLISDDGELRSMSFDDMAKLMAYTSENTATSSDTTIVQNFYPTNNYITGDSTGANSQTLSISGRTISISGGNSIELPADANTTYSYASSSADGILSSADWNNFAAKENSLLFSNGLVRAGDTISLMSCAAGQILKNDGTVWICAADSGGAGGAYTAGSGISISATDVISNTGVLTVSSSGALTTNNTDPQNPALTLATTSDLTQLGNQLALSDTGVTAGTYNNVTVDSKGRVTAGTNVSYLTSFTETDGVIGNEIADVVTGGGLVMTGAGTAADPYKVGMVTTCSDGQLLKYYSTDPDGAGPLTTGWNCASDIDTDTNTDEQTLSWNTATNQLTISGGNTIDISSVNTDNQALSLAGNTLSISGNAATIDLSKYLDNTDEQTLSWDNGTRTLSLTNGGSVVIPDANTDTNTTYSAGVNGGLVLDGTAFSLMSCSTGQVLKASATAGQWECAADLQGTAGPIVLGTDTSGDYIESLTAGSGIKILGTPGEGWSPTVAFADGTADGQYWTWNATTSTWQLTAAPMDTDTTYTAGNGLSLIGTAFSLSQNGANQGDVMYWDGVQWTPTAIGYTCSQASGAFCNDGNNFGGLATIGTNDAYGLNFETSGTTVMSISPTGEVLIKDPTDTTYSFRVADSAGLAHFSVDTQRNRITLGGSNDSTAIMLVLDHYNVATDPVGTNGAMYYNSVLGKFRCFESGWKDCIAGGSQVLVDGYANTAQNIPSAYNVFRYNNMQINVGGAYNTSTGLFTAPETGWYRIKGSLNASLPVGTAVQQYYVTLSLRRSGYGNIESSLGGATPSSAATGAFITLNVNKLTYLTQGETASFTTSWASSGTPTLYTALSANVIQITREYDVR